MLIEEHIIPAYIKQKSNTEYDYKIGHLNVPQQVTKVNGKTNHDCRPSKAKYPARRCPRGFVEIQVPFCLRAIRHKPIAYSQTTKVDE